ncbi:hypothetical protein CkaCkLH20_10413 [Colletotrichum karsti]|uniref:Purine and uridine phosphorylase n=1 Tax=Colletotrichum karsti TaxID=1095194 RepID=A0A9P6I131_9PEZI|nr:uncharacterized protein CkaCkLH20_10413 [Colletotrichum karsti]KAF9872076.1 hypothetical protein CkaCkLH20_10413 [Colletotrichum karsti]
MTNRLQHGDYRVAWICPMEVEQIAAEEMLDEEHDDLPQSEADHNVYKLGSINGHNIVIAGLHETGNCSAAAVVTQMRMTFRKLKFGLLVGIGGGVPVATDCGMIRLGHVVVSKPAGAHSGVVQYDHGKAISEGLFERTGSLAPPPAVLLNAARQMGVQRKRAKGKRDPILENVSRIDPKHPPFRQFGFEYPGEENDFLFPSGHRHQQQGISCEAGGCDLSTRVLRLEDTDRTFVTVHMGNIASGERVIKDATLRDGLAKQYGLLCFEMEAAGVSFNFPCLTIRGISDYCDSHKNDRWRGYAAAVAAGYTRQLFFHMPVEEVQRVQLPTSFTLAFQLSGVHSVETFISRETELMRMHELLKGPRDRRIVVLHGLGGMGKTQKAVQYAKRHREEYSAVIWLNAKDVTSLQQTFHRAARRILSEHPSVAYLQTATSNQDLNRSVEAVLKWLNEKGNDRWLIVYDNYDAVKFDGDDSSSQMTVKDETRTGPDANETDSNSYDIRPYIPEAFHGAIITTRSSTVDLGHLIRLPKLEDVNDSLAILASTSQRERFSQEPDALSLARKLDGLPLALATAGAYLRQVSVTCTEYLEDWDKSWLQLQENTPRPRTYEQKALYSTWNISYQYIQRKNDDAAVLLRLWAYLDNEYLWYELLSACEKQSDAPVWLQRITAAKFDFHKTMRTLCEYGLAEASPPTKEPGPDSRGYSVHECVHAWITHVLNVEVDTEMAYQAIKCVSWHAPTDEEPEYWVLQRRLVRHADRCFRTAVRKNEAEADAETKEA